MLPTWQVETHERPGHVYIRNIHSDFAIYQERLYPFRVYVGESAGDASLSANAMPCRGPIFEQVRTVAYA